MERALPPSQKRGPQSNQSQEEVHFGKKNSVCMDDFALIYIYLQITNEQVANFVSEVAKFSEKFQIEGPASIGTDLESGVLYIGVVNEGRVMH